MTSFLPTIISAFGAEISLIIFVIIIILGIICIAKDISIQ